MPWSPIHGPYRGFFNPFCPMGRLEPRKPSPLELRRAQVSVTVAYLGPQRRERLARGTAFSAEWAPRGGEASCPCQRRRRFPSLSSFQGSSRGDTPLPGSARTSAPRYVTAPPQPMAGGSRRPATGPSRFKSESLRLSERERGRLGPGPGLGGGSGEPSTCSALGPSTTWSPET